MRTLATGFANHIASGATTLATCWKITRGDGVVLGFTDHDVALRFGSIDYLPAHGLDGGEAPQKLGPQVDTTEVVGVLHADAIAEDDILLGRYDGASVETWRVNWRNTSQRHLLRRETIGEIVREDGAFRAELRSGQHVLNRVSGRHYSSLCDATLGDARCGVNLDVSPLRRSASVIEVRDRFRLAVSDIGSSAEGFFSLGSATWNNGKRSGLVDRIVAHARPGGVDVLSFAEPVGDWVVAGNDFYARAGCDRSFATCRKTFGNVANFRGFPHIPGSDFVLRYPKRGETLDGGAWIE